MSKHRHSEQIESNLRSMRNTVRSIPSLVVEGKLTRIVGLTLEAEGCQSAVGGRCTVIRHDGREIEAEVVGFKGESLLLMPAGDTEGLGPNARVIPSAATTSIAVGKAMLGRVVDGAGNPLDGRGHIRTECTMPLHGQTINPLLRRPISQPLDVGVRVINTLFTIGRGQRLGLFSGSGVGKSILLGMMTRFTQADIIVVGLIGERGREVKEFIDNILGEEGLRRAVVVATPADNPPLLRIRGAMLATTIAEYFRDQGKQVLLLMDSLTRFAQAQREIGLAIGEPPATRGFPPSVFAKIPVLVERAGNSQHQGSITAFYTVLTEGDMDNDPVADTARAILDGHIVLSRQLAESGLYPAIDVEASISRAINEIVSTEQFQTINRFKQMYTTFENNRDLINVGAYAAGSDPAIDEAITMRPKLLAFIRQPMNQAVTLQQGYRQLQDLVPATAANSTAQIGGA